MSQPFVEVNGIPADDNKLDFVFAEGLDEVLEVFIKMFEDCHVWISS
jgi:hypothetical protein